MNNSITFGCRVVAYQYPNRLRSMTVMETKELIESGDYELEFIFPLDGIAVIIIKPKELNNGK